MQNLQENFLTICDMEIHMDEHENGKNYKCNSCGETFNIKWRPSKHEKNHKKTDIKIVVTLAIKNPALLKQLAASFFITILPLAETKTVKIFYALSPTRM